MLALKTLGYRLTDQMVEDSRTVIDRSMAVEFITEIHGESRGRGGRKPAGTMPGIRAVLTVMLCLLRIGRVPTVAECHRVLSKLTKDQRECLGMPGPMDNVAYPAFHAWLTRLLRPFDTVLDQPARRIRNEQHREILKARTIEQKQAAAKAEERRNILINLLVAGSIDEHTPTGAHGDVVADETIVDLAGPGDELGAKPARKRGAVAIGGFYYRDRKKKTAASGEPVRNVTKMGFGIGITAVSRVGGVDNLYGVPPVMTGIAIHSPTSGSVEALQIALDAHKRNGFDQRTSHAPNAKMPHLAVDMGYSVKKGFNSMVLRNGYAPVVRYPKTRKTIWASDSEEHQYRGQSAGPIQVDGAFYCPAVMSQLDGKRPIGRTADLLNIKGGFKAYDAMLQQRFPFLMGTNSRPKPTRLRGGRPSLEEQEMEPEVYKIELVCPAVQSRVKCPLKPESLVEAHDKPLAEPTWDSSRYRCCSKSQISLRYSTEQWKLAQWGLVPGSWEHQLYYEAARCLTEQRFSIMKSINLAGFEQIKWGPRREPLLVILIGLWVAATNIAIQDVYYSRPVNQGQIARHFKNLEKDLGRPPTMIPART